MSRNYKERIKSIVLFILLIASVMQAGMLWNNIDHSFPFYYIAAHFSNAQKQLATDSALQEIPDGVQIALNPYKISVCDGEETHYIVPRKSETFTRLLETNIQFYEEILSDNGIKELALEEWGNLVSRKSFLVEFKVPLQQDVIKWAIDLYNNTSTAPNEIQKLLITLNEGIDGQVVRLFVLTPNKIIQYHSKTVRFDFMQQLFTECVNDIESDSLNIAQYKTIGEFGGSGFPGFNSDVLCVIEGQKSKMFRKLKYAVPSDIRDKAELENTILGDDIHSYNRALDFSNTLVFKNITSIYRLYKDGLLEYNYTPVVQINEKGAMTKSLANTLHYVQNIETNLLGSADLYLSGISEDPSGLTYRFTFDYILDDCPVLFQYTQRQGEAANEYRNAITIQANESRIISCRWLFVDLYFGTDIQKMQMYFETIDIGESLTKLSIKDINVAYYINMNQYNNNSSIWPVWMLESADGEIKTVPMREG